MMNEYDDRLKELQDKIHMKGHLERVLKNLKKQQAELEQKVDELDNQRMKEQSEVDRLEGSSLRRFFYNVVGKQDEKLSKERQEAYEASVRYDAAYQELKAVEADIRYQELEYGRVRRSEEEYQSVLAQKISAFKASDHPKAGEILALEEKIAKLKAQEKEIQEAISAGNTAIHLAEQVLGDLSSAHNYGAWDVLGGGLIADMAKHSHLDDAQNRIERLQVELRRFKTELSDVNINAGMQVSIDGFLRFADYFYDGLFADIAVLERIKESQTRITNVKNQILTVMGVLNTKKTSVTGEKNLAEHKLRELMKSL